ncbi:kinase-like domain-containing protein [Thelephora terrestris]|uniref:Kinase-like domain-containing protein n=1 Tax=Thelephora terrestris TaxID=56493 RepID=A0A9P6L9V5_9AGAM|nr:kinase-like domain-containing protein [Thelephora terrestris]
MARDFERLWEDVTAANDEAGAVRALAEILAEKEGRDFISHLYRGDAVFCIDILDRGIAGRDLNIAERHAFFVTLRRLAGLHGRLPDSMMISDTIEIEDNVLASGGFADVRRGRHKGHSVAVKTLRLAATDDLQKVRKQFCKEVVLWSTLCHSHVLKLEGVYGDMEKGQFITISELMIHGNIMEYIERNHVNRLELLHGAAQGLKYIHGVGLVHGDLKGANILMSNDTPPRACLMDFGFMTTVLDPQESMSCSATLVGGTMRFMPPESLMPSVFGVVNPIPTPEADIYALGLVVFQVLTGEIPFRNIRITEIGFRLAMGDRPEKPANAPAIGFSDSLWTFAQRCWDGDRTLRPKVAEVVTRLAEAAANWNTFESPDWPSRADFSKSLIDSSFALKPPSKAQDELSDSGESKANPKRYEHKLLARTGRVLEDLNDPGVPLPQSPICSSDPGSSLSIGSLVDSIEIPAVLTNSPPLRLAEINAKYQGQELIDRLDMALDRATCDQERRELLNSLCKTCDRLRMLPKSMHLEGRPTEGLVEVNSGGHAVIFRAEHSGRSVAVKTIRITSSTFDKCHREFCREAVAWRHLRHPNILPLLGVDLEPRRLSMVSEWMDHGNINEYLKRHQKVNRLQLLVDAATGLGYMHSIKIVHGDLKGANILINQSHRACLVDFGLSTIASVEYNTGTNASSISVVSKASLMSFTAGGTTRWISPELLHPERFGASDDRPTKKSDCYALGMVVYEVLSGNSPYRHIKNPEPLMCAIMNGYRPKKPKAAESLGFTDELWKAVQRCWLTDASARPDVGTMLSHLNHATWFWEMATGFNRLWKNARAAQNKTDAAQIIAQILASKDGQKFILALERADAELCVEYLDHMYERGCASTEPNQTFFETLMRLSGSHALLPDSMVIKDDIEHPDFAQLQTSGGFADIKQGRHNTNMVAVKTMRVAVTDDFDKLRKQFCKEVIIWNSLSHPNVLRLVGVLSGFGGHQFATVSEWMVHGNIMEYIRKHSTNRLRLLHGAVNGLKYLHDAHLVHGDLKGPNILMTNDTPPTACLADFGFTTLVLDPLNPMSSSLTLQGGTMAFMAPELLAPSNYGLKNSVPTQEADIYAFGLVLFQVLTGDQPFRTYTPQELGYYVSVGIRPDKPANAKEIGISNALWKLMQVCWHRNIEGRPQIQKVVKGVGNAAAKWRADMLPSGTERREDHAGRAGIFESHKAKIFSLRLGQMFKLKDRR